MGSFLDKPKTEKTNDHGQGNDLRYGLGAMQGWRIEMEDSHSAIIGLPKPGLEGWSFFAVFDGHAGGTVSKCSSKELLNSILNADNDLFNELASIYGNQNSNTNSSSSSASSSHQPNTSSSSNISLNNCSPTKHADSTTPNNHESTTSDDTKSTTINKNEKDSADSNNKNINEESSINSSNTNSIKNKFTPMHEERLKKAVRQGFLDLDQNLRDRLESDKGDDKSGSTAVACLITPSHVYLINCGDSRAILVSGNKVVLGTYDHKPINPNERERIQNAGGSVMIQRVNGSLAVSRALGDYEYKCVEGRGPCEQLVSPEPEIYAHERNPERDEFVVLACDGIWDVMSNDELKEFVHSRLKITNDLVKISNEILDMCLNKGSRDNMSLIIVSFPGAPKVDEGEIQKENNINERIESRVKELIESSNTRIEFTQILNLLSEENWDDLPPGGGLHAKHALIEEIYNRLSPKSNEDDNMHNANYLMNQTL